MNKWKRFQKRLLIGLLSLGLVFGNVMAVPTMVYAEEQEAADQEESKDESSDKEESKDEDSDKEEPKDEDADKEEPKDEDSDKEEPKDEDADKEEPKDEDTDKEEPKDEDADKEEPKDEDADKEEPKDEDADKEEPKDEDADKEEPKDEDADKELKDENANKEDFNEEETEEEEFEQEELLKPVVMEVLPEEEEVFVIARDSQSRANTKTQEIEVGSRASLQSLKTLVASCPYCDGDLTEDAAEKFRNVSANVADNEVLRYIDWTIGRKPYSGLQVPCMEMHFQGLRPGTTNVTMKYQANFERDYSEGYCDFCGYPVAVPSDYSWYNLQDTFNVVVSANYKIIYNGNGDEVTNMPSATTTKVASETATLNVTSQEPKRTGYKFLGWAESATATAAQYNAGASITLEWEQGSTVSKTLYAVWSDDEKEDTSYKVVREYYIKGEKVASLASAAISGKVGDTIDGATLAEEHPEWVYYTIDEEKVTFSYKGYTPNPFVLTEDTNQKIVLKYESECNHDNVDYTDNGDGTHDGVCSDCHETVVDDEDHVYENGTCIKCGAEEPKEECKHENVDYTDNGDGTHDGVCSDCHETVVDNENHEFDANNVCIKCGAKKDSGEGGNKPGEGGEEKPEGCEHKNVEYTDNGDGTHDGVCKDCDKTVVDDEKHEYKDGECIKCGAKEPEEKCDHNNVDYKDNGDGTHDGVCSDCHETVVDDEDHVYENGTCIKCGAEEPKEECDHENIDYTDNGDGTHDGVCSDCHETVVDHEDHEFDENGICTKCGAKKDSGEGGNKPGEGENKPGEGGNKPGEGENKPGEGGNKPNDQINKDNTNNNNKNSGSRSKSKSKSGNNNNTGEVSVNIEIPIENTFDNISEQEIVDPNQIPTTPSVIEIPDTTVGQDQWAGDDAEVTIPRMGDESNDAALYIMFAGCAFVLALAVFARKKIKDGETEL